jgi:hypothetical protein
MNGRKDYFVISYSFQVFEIYNRMLKLPSGTFSWGGILSLVAIEVSGGAVAFGLALGSGEEAVKALKKTWMTLREPMGGDGIVANGMLRKSSARAVACLLFSVWHDHFQNAKTPRPPTQTSFCEQGMVVARSK